mgnify:CR=1 FL=1
MAFHLVAQLVGGLEEPSQAVRVEALGRVDHDLDGKMLADVHLTGDAAKASPGPPLRTQLWGSVTQEWGPCKQARVLIHEAFAGTSHSCHPCPPPR